MDNPRGVSSCHVLSWAFGDAYCRRENVRHATLLFSAVGGCATESRETAKGKHKMYCTKCGNQVNDAAAFCTKCGAPMNGKQWTANEDIPSASGSDSLRRPKIPGITLAACIILYVFFGCGLLTMLSEAGGTPFVFLAGQVGFSLLFIALVVYIQKGRNWARIALTGILGFIMLALNIIVPFGGLIIGVIYALPLVFLWLPRSNNWYRAIKACSK